MCSNVNYKDENSSFCKTKKLSSIFKSGDTIFFSLYNDTYESFEALFE